MEPFSREVFELFQQKLKVGNRRGVHLNAIPNNSRYKFDLSRLSSIFRSLPERFILDLLTLKNLKFSFSLYDTPSTAIDERSYTTEVTHSDSKKSSLLREEDRKKLPNEREALLEKLSSSIDDLIFQSEAIFQEKGVNPLGFGFPILVRRDLSDGQISVAPILIWSVRIRPTNQINTWEISRTEEDPIYINEVLINHLQNDSGITLSSIPEEMLEDGKIDKSELLKICTDILQQLKINQNIDFLENNYAEILPIQSKAHYESLLPERGQAIIEKSGLFSLFEVQKQNIINDYSYLKDSFEQRNFPSKDTFQSFSSVSTDPSQQEILERIRTQSHILIQGPPGTGKSQTLSAILINALENGQKTLVVCEKQTALEVLHKSLQDRELGKYTILIKDSLTDRKIVVDAVRNIIDDPSFKKAIPPYPEATRKEQIEELDSLKGAINRHHTKLFSPILSQENWTEITAQILEYEPKKEEINLSSLPITFSEEEYKSLKTTLEKAQELFIPFASYKEDFLFHPETFIHNSYLQTTHNIEEAFTNYRTHWEKILLLYQEYKEFYLNKRKEEFTYQLEELSQYINETETITSLLSSSSDEYNREKTNNFLYKFLSIFSSAKKIVLKNQKRLLFLCQEIKKISLHTNFSPITLTDNLLSNKENIINYRQEISSAKASFEQKILKDFDVLDVLNFFEPKFTNDSLRNLVSEVNLLKETLKKEHYVSSFDWGNTFGDFKQYIEALLSKYITYQKDPNNPLFAGYEWYTFFESLNHFQKQCICLLENANVSDWKASFWHAYYRKLLIQKSNEYPTFSSRTYEDFRKKLQLFGASQYDIIRNYWDNAQQSAVKNFETVHKDLSVANLYNKRKSEKHNRLPLRQIAQKDTDLLTTFFPIILTTPDTCSNLFQGKNFYFDYVIFDEASQLKLEDNLPAILKGKTVIIAGDEHQMPPSNYFSKIFDGSLEDEEDIDEEDNTLVKKSLLSVESLLDFALEYQYDKHHLNFHYRSRHPYLIDFSNVAFYNGKLRALPSFDDTPPIEFYQIDGEFDDHINEAEALKVIDILRNLPQKADGSYPSVGIATFNITQRNFIRKKLLSLRNKPEEEAFSAKLTALEQSGLFIKNLENIQGDERDIIIISVTYGRKKGGKFTQSFGPINHQKGYKLLNVIITRAKEKIFICNSIPEELFLSFNDALEQEKSNNRRAVLYAYLAYTKAVSEKNDVEREKILKILSKYGNNQPETTSSGQLRFKEQVFLLLKEKFPTIDITKNFSFGGYTIDILLKNAQKTPIAIECISKSIYQNEMGYLEDLHKEKIISQSGYHYLRIHADVPMNDYLMLLEKQLN